MKYLLFAPLILLSAAVLHAAELTVAPPSDATVAEFKLPTFYKQCILLEGFPVVASEKVSPVALQEAAYLVQQMLRKRPDVLRELAKNKVRLAVMGRNEYTCDVPEHSKLRPAGYWNRRARGLGPSPDAPAVSCGEENLLCLKGDHYGTENILIHEFAHAIHLMGLNTLDRKFDQRLSEMYDSAIRAGLFVGTYAGSNHAEYFAEAVQSWFDTNRENDREHNHVNTREELKKYDPAISGMMAEIFGDDEWRYVRPEKRKEPAHFAGYDASKEAPFAWPEPMVQWYKTNLESDGPTTEDIDRLELAKEKPSVPAGPEKQTTLLIVNRCKGPVRMSWVPPEGKPRPMGSVRPGMFEIQDTWRGHVWQFTREDGSVIGYTACLDRDGRVVVSE